MTLPNAHLAVAERSKITDYLLNAAHPDNGGKAPFFSSLGFDVQAWEVLAQAFRELAIAHPVTASSASSHGRKFVVEGRLQGPQRSGGPVRTIWIIEPSTPAPRLITAYPCG